MKESDIADLYNEILRKWYYMNNTKVINLNDITDTFEEFFNIDINDILINKSTIEEINDEKKQQ